MGTGRVGYHQIVGGEKGQEIAEEGRGIVHRQREEGWMVPILKKTEDTRKSLGGKEKKKKSGHSARGREKKKGGHVPWGERKPLTVKAKSNEEKKKKGPAMDREGNTSQSPGGKKAGTGVVGGGWAF